MRLSLGVLLLACFLVTHAAAPCGGGRGCCAHSAGSGTTASCCILPGQEPLARNAPPGDSPSSCCHAGPAPADAPAPESSEGHEAGRPGGPIASCTCFWRTTPPEPAAPDPEGASSTETHPDSTPAGFVPADADLPDAPSGLNRPPGTALPRHPADAGLLVLRL